MPATLYTWPAQGSLPSLTAAALAVEAALRLGKVDFCVQRCTTPSSSPTGVLPAVDTGADVPAGEEAGDLAAARAILAALAKRGLCDLDAWLTPPQHAELLAFSTLLASRLEPATNYTTWLEKRGFGEFRKAAYGTGLPFPLSYVVPWSQRSEMARQLGHIDGFKAYQGAVEALAALADRLRASPGRFFFGDRPSSLDAALFGQLAFYKHSPVAAPVLRDKVLQSPVLSRYVEAILGDVFDAEMPPPPADDPGAGASSSSGSWSEAAQGAASAPKKQATVEEVRMWRGSQYWLGGAAAAVSAYVLLGGQYISINSVELGDEDEELVDEDEDEEVIET